MHGCIRYNSPTNLRFTSDIIVLFPETHTGVPIALVVFPPSRVHLDFEERNDSVLVLGGVVAEDVQASEDRITQPVGRVLIGNVVVADIPLGLGHYHLNDLNS